MNHDENIASNNNSSSVADYEVGYKKPPVHARFKPGICANPKGRPKKNKSDIVNLLLSELQKRIFIEENGKRIKVTKREVLVKQILKKALMGDSKCLDFVLRVEEMHAPRPAEVEKDPGFPDRLVSPVWKQYLREEKAKKALT